MTAQRTARFALLIVVVAGVAGCEVEVREETFEVREVSGVIDRLTVRTGSGDVEVVAEETESITIEAVIHGAGTEIDQSVRGSELLLETNCDHQQWFCSVDYRISVPQYLAARLDSGSGDIAVAGLSGDVLVETGSGDVEVRCLTSEVVGIDTGSGSIGGAGLRIDVVSATTGSGDIDLSHDVAPQSVDVEAGSGDIDLDVPADSYAIDADTGSGNVRITGVQRDGSASRTIRASSGSGDISINGR